MLSIYKLKGVKMKNKKITYTKIMVTIYSIAIIVWITWSYILATLGFEEIVENLSVQVVIIGVASILGYFLKSFFETKEQEKIKLEKENLKILVTTDSTEDEDLEYKEQI